MYLGNYTTQMMYVMIIILGDRQRKMRELWGVHVCMYLYNKRERMKRWLEHIA